MLTACVGNNFFRASKRMFKMSIFILVLDNGGLGFLYCLLFMFKMESIHTFKMLLYGINKGTCHIWYVIMLTLF